MKAGDQVQLKSGGPAMTVEVEEVISNQVRVVWWDSGLCQRKLPAECLKEYEPPESPFNADESIKK